MEVTEMQWYKTVFSQARIDTGDLQQLRNAIAATLVGPDAGPCGPYVALFISRPTGSSETTLYLSPDAAGCLRDQLTRYQMEPCARPQLADVQLDHGMVPFAYSVFKDAAGAS